MVTGFVATGHERQVGCIQAEVIAVERRGAYHRLRFLAPHIASASGPGQFIAVAVGDDLGMVLRRYFSVFDVDPARGFVDFVVAVHNRGTAWLSRRGPGDVLDVLGPLGRPFPEPEPGASTLVVGGGYGSAALFRLVRKRAGLGDRVHVLLGGADSSRLYAPERFDEFATDLWISTEDGSLGTRGSICDLLDPAMEQFAPDVVYACGPMPMLEAASRQLAGQDVITYVATEARMACGIGVCMTCVLPIARDDGTTRMTRSCVDGPVFKAEHIRWEDIGAVPTAVGGPR